MEARVGRSALSSRRRSSASSVGVLMCAGTTLHAPRASTITRIVDARARARRPLLEPFGAPRGLLELPATSGLPLRPALSAASLALPADGNVDASTVAGSEISTRSVLPLVSV